MDDPNRTKFKNNFLYWGLFLYFIFFLWVSPHGANPDVIRIPAFALLLLVLVQVIFPNFRLSKVSNAIAISLIILLALIIPNFPLR